MNIINQHTPIKYKNLFRIRGVAFGLAVWFSSLSHAAPVGGIVTVGTASINSAGSNTTITQSSPKAIINWQGFSVGSNESVKFIQPSRSAIALNRVVGPDASSILGNLSANGKVFLINPNGILFGNGAQVNVGGMVASTLGISDANFIAGNYQFTGNSAASIINQGSISTNIDGSYIALLGANISNNGLISARLGTVALAAGNGVTLDLVGDNLLKVTVDQGAVNALVSNGNLLIADGGQVLMTARGAGTLLSNTVNNTGVIQAQSIESHNGLIILSSGSESGITNVSGLLDASGLGAGQTGGSVQTLGNKVNLVNANINASGNAGGGLVLVGGNFNGAGPQPNSLSTNINSASIINVDAIQSGNGGQIAIWSDGTTVVAGMLSARGGALWGNGGLIETSGKQINVTNTAYVNTLAPNGITGMWLLDPAGDFYIADIIPSGETGLTTTQVIANLASSNSTITATNDITVSSALTWATAHTLTLDAGHDININAAIVGSTDGANLILKGGNDVLINAAITAGGATNQINVTAAHDITASGTLTAGGQINMTAGHNAGVATVTTSTVGSQVNMKAKNNVTVGTVTSTGGSTTLYADSDGSGAGTVIIGTTITATNTTLRFDPVTYATTSTEVAGYTARITGGKDVKAWVFLQGNNKVYNQSTAATIGFVGTPTDASAVTLVDGTASFADKNAATGKTITYSGYSLGGTSTNLALYSPGDIPGSTPGAGTTTATISPATLVVSATGTDKVYNGTTTDAVTLSDNRMAGDVFTTSNTSANFANASVGNNKVVNVLGISLAGTDAGNYTSNTSATTTASITNPAGVPIEPLPGAIVPGAVVPVVPAGESNQPPAALRSDLRQGDILPIPVIAMSAVAIPNSGIENNLDDGAVNPATNSYGQSSPNPALLTVVAAPVAIGMKSLFPPPYVAPIMIPKQGRN